MDDAPMIQVPANGKYPLSVAPVLVGVSSEGEMLGNISNLKFMDHDIIDAQKFPELAKEQYFRTRSIPSIGEILLEPHEWVLGLEKEGILNLLEIHILGGVQN
jgi:hypothetical protein